eukprot:TRINITY_DN16136_c0_g2_i1.p1 TRINITY_DN16136_c0_g2~~TRINITY_DN16136_c0_g2_i1.p1  ORF type:complete len:571 (+),score=91.56 TRINITY_DN16136_c0_g2_i1:53-1765(+)
MVRSTDTQLGVVEKYIERCGEAGMVPDPRMKERIQVGMMTKGGWAASVVQCGDKELKEVLNVVGDEVGEDGDLSLQISEANLGELSGEILNSNRFRQILSTLSIQNQTLTPSTISVLSSTLRHITHLSTLRLDRLNLSDTDATSLLKALSTHPNITNLSMMHNSLQFNSFFHMTALLKCVPVECCGVPLAVTTPRETMYTCPVCNTVKPDSARCCNRDLNTCTSCGKKKSDAADTKSEPTGLKDLDLTGVAMDEPCTAILSAALRGYHGLEKLNVTGTGVLSHPIFIEMLGQNSSITSLRMSRNEVPEGYDALLLNRIFACRPVKLVTLSVACCKGIARCLSGISQTLTGLTDLDLSGNTDVAVVDVLAIIQNVHGLKKIDLSDMCFSDQSMRSIGNALRRNPPPSLQELNIKGNKDVGDVVAIFNELLQSLNITIHRDLDLSGLWYVAAGSVPGRPDITYKITEVRHDVAKGTIKGQLPGKKETYMVTGRVVHPSIDVSIDWKNMRKSRLLLKPVLCPSNRNTPKLNAHSAAKIHLAGKLYNDYDNTEGDMAVVIQPNKEFKKLKTCLK